MGHLESTISIVVGVIAIISAASAWGVSLGVRRAEAKRIVKAEHQIEKVVQGMDEYKKELDQRLENRAENFDKRFARKDNLVVELDYIKSQLNEIKIDLRELKATVGRRRKDEV